MTAQTILIIEDDRDIAELLACNLEGSGYRTITMGDGLKGLKAALRYQPDLVLLDVMLPGMAGTEVCRALRKNHKLKELPIIFLTARHEEGDRVMGLELGADDYVVKPFSVRELLLRGLPQNLGK
jgi:two-component system, OmpR family, phosphate regulon response regulator PhoB